MTVWIELPQLVEQTSKGQTKELLLCSWNRPIYGSGHTGAGGATIDKKAKVLVRGCNQIFGSLTAAAGYVHAEINGRSESTSLNGGRELKFRGKPLNEWSEFMVNPNRR